MKKWTKRSQRSQRVIKILFSYNKLSKEATTSLVWLEPTNVCVVVERIYYKYA